MIFYITKYALTQGIIEIDTDTLDSYRIDGGYLTTFDENFAPATFRTGEWYSTKSFALSDAEHRRIKKIESLKKQIEKLEKIKFK